MNETTYRTGNDPLTPEQEKIMSELNEKLQEQAVEEKVTAEATSEAVTEDATAESEQQSPDQATMGTEQAPNALDDIETAVLLVVNKHGNVLPVVNIDSLEMRRIATPREVYRICLDAADQLSSVSVLGEMTNIFASLQRESAKFTATQMANLLIKAQQTKSEGEQ